MVRDVMEKSYSLRSDEAVIKTAQAAGGVVVTRWAHEAAKWNRIYKVDTVALCQLRKAEGRLLFWSQAAVHHLLVEMQPIADHADRHPNG